MKKIAIILAIIVLAASTAFFGYRIQLRGQSVERILASQRLQNYGINIEIPQYSHYRFMGRDELAVEVALRVQGTYGTYYFTPGGLTDRLIADIVHVSEEGMRFALDKLGVSVSEPLSFVFNVTRRDESLPMGWMWNGGAVFGTSTMISVPARRMPTLIVHEAVHAILRYDNRLSNFPRVPEDNIWAGAMFLEEGLADYIDFLFSQNTSRTYRTNYRTTLHDSARRTLERNNNFTDASQWGTRYAQLMAYDTAASFIYFLIEQRGGTMADFMQVFDDIYLAEKVFGAGLDELIRKWLAYISV